MTEKFSPTRRGFLAAVAGIGTAAIVPFRIEARPAVVSELGKNEVEAMGPGLWINDRKFPMVSVQVFDEQALMENYRIGSDRPIPPTRGRRFSKARIEVYLEGNIDGMKVVEELGANPELVVVIPAFHGSPDTTTLRGWYSSASVSVCEAAPVKLDVEMLVSEVEVSHG